MIYLVRTDDTNGTIEIAACEGKRLADARVADGYEIVTPAQFRSAWRARDLETFIVQVSNLPAPVLPKERTVGGPNPPSTLPVGFSLFKGR